MNKNKKEVSRSNTLKLVILLTWFVFLWCFFTSYYYYLKLEEKKVEVAREKEIIEDINSHYGDYVIVENDTTLYRFDSDSGEYKESGIIYKGEIVDIKDQEITSNTIYFYIDDLDLYISYEDVSPSEAKSKNMRYKEYIPFNKSIVTNDVYSLYNEDNNAVFKLYGSSTYPVIINDYNGKYYIEYNDELFGVDKSDIKEIVDSNNTDIENTSDIAVLNYHFIYSDDKSDCNQLICLSESNFKKQLDYIENKGILTLKMKEFEMYLDGQIQLPKSVLITIDDGWYGDVTIRVLEEYKMYATFFLITAWYSPVESEYVEFHSHSHHLHNLGDCPTGQGGGIQCLSSDIIQDDLLKSREVLNNTTYFCYPFYEYNNYSIEELKKAGFTMAFAGGSKKATIGVNKFAIPRYPIFNYTTVDDIAEIIG